jgi:hypothetical protein
MHVVRFILFMLAMSAPVMALAQYEVLPPMSLGSALDMSHMVAERQVQKDILRKERGGSRSADASSAGAGSGTSFFTAALAPGRAAAVPAVDTRFRRQPAVEQQAHANILGALEKRQPQAVPEFRRLFATTNLPAWFEDVLRPYGLRADDAADALTAYWVMAWAVAHRITDDSGLPSPQMVADVRSQVARGFALTPVGRYDPTRRQLLADEAIFNFLVLNGAWRTARNNPAQFDRLAAATQRNFLALGADLGRLAIGPGGFAQR